MRKLTAIRGDEIYEDAKNQILHYLETIDIAPYSANLISIRLRIVANKLGNSAANRLIEELSLDKYGYHKEKSNK